MVRINAYVGVPVHVRWKDAHSRRLVAVRPLRGGCDRCRDRSQAGTGRALVRHFYGQSRPIKITSARVAGVLSVTGARMPSVLADVSVRGGGICGGGPQHSLVLVAGACAEGTPDGDADPADRRRPAGPAFGAAGACHGLRCAGHRPRRDGAGGGGIGSGLGGRRGRERRPVRAEPGARRWSGRAVRGRRAARRAALHAGRAAADRRRGAVPGRPHGTRSGRRRGRGPAPRRRGPRRGRRPSPARRADPHRPFRRGGRPAGRPRRLPSALRGHGLARGPRHGGRPGVDERYDAGRHPRHHPPGRLPAGRAAARG